MRFSAKILGVEYPEGRTLRTDTMTHQLIVQKTVNEVAMTFSVKVVIEYSHEYKDKFVAIKIQSPQVDNHTTPEQQESNQSTRLAVKSQLLSEEQEKELIRQKSDYRERTVHALNTLEQATKAKAKPVQEKREEIAHLQSKMEEWNGKAHALGRRLFENECKQQRALS